MKKCPLCCSHDVLRKSHILPEFVYDPTYDEKHTAILFQPARRQVGKRRTGFWERLLCDDCETRVNKWETYFADVWFRRPLRPKALDNNIAVISGLDYASFKLFHLSILWRAGISTLQTFEQIRLGRHADRIRDLLRSGDPGPAELYPIAGIALRDTDSRGFKDSIISLPTADRIQGHHVYRTLFGGVFWYCAISGHGLDCPVPRALTPDGNLVLLVEDWSKNRDILYVAKEAQRLLGTSD